MFYVICTLYPISWQIRERFLIWRILVHKPAKKWKVIIFPCTNTILIREYFILKRVRVHNLFTFTGRQIDANPWLFCFLLNLEHPVIFHRQCRFNLEHPVIFHRQCRFNLEHPVIFHQRCRCTTNDVFGNQQQSNMSVLTTPFTS